MFDIKLKVPQIDLIGGNVVYTVKFVRDISGVTEFLICDDNGNFQFVNMDNCYCG